MIDVRLTQATKTGSVRRLEGDGEVSGTMRAGTAALMLACVGLVSLPDACVNAQTTGADVKVAQAVPPDAPPRRRPPTRLRVVPYYYDEQNSVYPRYNPGPDAVRECNATYVQEYRPSGTVIVPRMSCYWRRG
jgi:hypothetical protein